MTPAFWQRVEDCLSSALELPAERRAAFVRSQCGDDQELSREVLSLIATHEQAPAARVPFAAIRDALAALETEYYLGRVLGKYRVEEYLGRGATSTVYHARETTSGQDVAIKIFAPNSPLPVPGPAVDHPNIVKIIEFNEHTDVRFLVMELVDGETVAQRIRRSAFSWRELIPVARQIAAGLAVAHRQGICHGDLKPANLMISSSGIVKILDFGSPAGTADYLSPERASGEGPDPRGDVFAFGATLYEMATGKRDSRRSRRAAIYAPLAALIDRCMDKDRERRYPDGDALATALDQLKPPSRLDSLRARVNWRPLIAAGAVATVLVATLAFLFSPPKAPPQFRLITEETSLAIGPTLSPDGKLLAYAANRDGAIGLDIWVQTVSMGTPLRLTTDDADDFSPIFSPDGKWIVFASDREGGGLFRIPASGGLEERIGPAGTIPRFSPDGKWISYVTGPRGPRNRDVYMPRRIYLLPASGGAPQPFHAEFASAHMAVWSPDGKRILFSGHVNPREPDSWWIGKLDGSPAIPVSAPSPERSGDYVFKQNAMLAQCWLPDGRLVFLYYQGSQIALLAVPFSLQRSRFMGNPQTLVAASNQAVNPMCAPNGELVYTSLRPNAGLWTVSLDDTHALRPATPVHPGLAALPSLTADGTKLAYVARANVRSSAILRDLETGDDHVLEESKPRYFWLRQSLDGARLASLEDANAGGLLSIRDNLNGRVQEFPGVKRPLDFSSDARFVLALSGERQSAIVLHQAGARGSLPLLRHSSMKLNHARFSPDQRWIAFSAQRDDEPPRTFLVRFHGGREIPISSWKPATSVNAVNAEWAPDGQALYFFSEHDNYICLAEQRLDKQSRSPLGEARVIRHFHHMAISLWQVAHNHRALSVSRGKVVLNLVSSTGGIWLMR